jgi:uncharacterized protein YdhG (YjbR/CyaY superfamily)
VSNNKVIIDSIDAYIASFPWEIQKALEEIRSIIIAAVPDAREKISYQIPTFELNGRNLVHFAAWKNHVAMYPIPSGTATFEKELAQYIAGKGTIKFPIDKPLPLELIREIVKFQAAHNLKKTGKRTNENQSL